MNSLFRQVVLLVLAVALFLVVLATVLWGKHEVAAAHAERTNAFLAPSQAHLARAQRTLVTLRSDLGERGDAVYTARPVETRGAGHDPTSNHTGRPDTGTVDRGLRQANLQIDQPGIRIQALLPAEDGNPLAGQRWPLGLAEP